MEIRISNINDIENISKLMLNYYPSIINKNEFLKITQKILLNDLKNKKRISYIILDKNKIIGKIFIQIIDMLPNEFSLNIKFGYLSNLYILPKYRGEKLSEKLINEIINYAKKNNLERLNIWTSNKTNNTFTKL
ncbi:MAG: GNAT family N-acetyltransferase [Nanoarchaeales archaeon]|nr:GNAT family N-acetyltransferase [Nanoarchaeales archaeon]